MIRKRSLNRKRRSSKRQFKNRRSRRRHFGIKKDNMILFISKLIKPKKLLELLTYLRSLTTGTLQNLKPSENIKLTCWQKIQRSIINWFRPKINEVINKLYPAQLVLLIKGEYNTELRNKLLFNTELPNVNETQISGFKENIQLMFLRSQFGKTILHSIKKFIKSLSPNQLVLLINGQFNLKNALYNSFLHTKYPTSKEVKNSAKEITEEIAEPLEVTEFDSV